MLIEFFGENFGCFRDEFRLSMLATDIDPDDPRGTVEVRIKGDPEPLKLLRAAAIYGPNASGKSTVIRAAWALRFVVSGSHESRSDEKIVVYEPFAFGPSSKAPCRLGVKAIVDGLIYDYEIRFDRKSFLFERLVQWQGDDTITLFERVEQEVRGEWTQHDTFRLLASDFGSNKLLLTLADRLAPSLAKGIARGLRRLLLGFGGDSVPLTPLSGQMAAKRARAEPQFGPWLLGHLIAADVGVTDFRTDEVQYMVKVEGQSQEEVQKGFRLSLVDSFSEGSAEISFERESLGTRRLIEVAPMLYDLSHDKAPMASFADELDASLHPTVFRNLIQHFNCEVADPRGQLIFATHETLLMDDEAKSAPLRRDQIYLTEKAEDGSAKLYSVGDFKERNNLNVRKRYLEGRYGAIPMVATIPE